MCEYNTVTAPSRMRGWRIEEAAIRPLSQYGFGLRYAVVYTSIFGGLRICGHSVGSEAE